MLATTRRTVLTTLAATALPVGSRAQGLQHVIDRTKPYFTFFGKSIEPASIDALRKQVSELVNAGVSDITLVIQSGGGSIDAALAAYEFLRALPATLRAHAQGFVDSVANVLFLAAPARSADHDVRFMFHPTTLTVRGDLNEAQLAEERLHHETVDGLLGQIYRERTRFPDLEIDRFMQGRVYYTPEQAQGFGVIQSIVDLAIPGGQQALITVI